MVATPTRDEVEQRYNGSPVSDGELDSTQADNLIGDAVDMAENLFGDQVLFTSELESEDTAVIYLACHKWALALGEVQSESQSGGSVTYNVPPPTERSLRRTTYGLEFLEYTQSEPNISIFTT